MEFAALFRLFFIGLRIFVAAFVLISILFFFFQDKLIFFPARRLEAAPTQIGLAYEDLFLKTKDGVRIHAWYIPSEKNRAAMLFCHGNAGNISHRLESIALYHQFGFNILIFDYRGYGKSGGRPDEDGLYQDARAAYDFLRDVKKTPTGKIIIFGRSLGGAVACETALTHPCGALIMESAFTSTADMGRRLYPFFPTRFLIRHAFASIKKISRVKCPILIIHSRDDEMIPFAMGESLYQTARTPKTFLPIHGSHNSGFLTSGRYYIQGLDQFVSRHLPR